MDDPFTEEEVLRVINQMPSNKARGPDGFASDFSRNVGES
jgi:hypothetical protein